MQWYLRYSPTRSHWLSTIVGNLPIQIKSEYWTESALDANKLLPHLDTAQDMNLLPGIIICFVAFIGPGFYIGRCQFKKTAKPQSSVCSVRKSNR
jgi:hypothetical protein